MDTNFWTDSRILFFATKFYRKIQFPSTEIIGIHRGTVWETFCGKDPPDPSTKSSKILDFSLFSLTCDQKNFDLELESETFKICWAFLSTRSLHFRALFLAAITLQKSFSGPKIVIFGIFSFGDVEHPSMVLVF